MEQDSPCGTEAAADPILEQVTPIDAGLSEVDLSGVLLGNQEQLNRACGKPQVLPLSDAPQAGCFASGTPFVPTPPGPPHKAAQSNPRRRRPEGARSHAQAALAGEHGERG